MQKVRRWDLIYGGPSPTSGRSLLRGVREIGQNYLVGTGHDLEYTGTTVPTNPLGEQTIVAGFAPGTAIRSSYLPDLRDLRWTSLVGDVDGDGRDDVVRVFASALSDELGTTDCGAPFTTRPQRVTRIQLRFGQPHGAPAPLSAPVVTTSDRNYVCHVSKRSGA